MSDTTGSPSSAPRSWTGLLRYSLGEGVAAFSTTRNIGTPFPVLCPQQVHGTRIGTVDRSDLLREDFVGVDGLVCALPGVAVGVLTADCVPVLMCDRKRWVVAAVHSGWRGTVGYIVHRALDIMEKNFGCDCADVAAVIGPSIGMASFQVGEEVVSIFESAGFPMEQILHHGVEVPGDKMSSGFHIDLAGAVRWQLLERGLNPRLVGEALVDTYRDARFFSARREGMTCGRTINAIALL